MRRALAWLLLACLALAAHARTGAFEATVTHVTDGDTLWVRPATGGAPFAVRLQGIDAPELCQAGGAQALAALKARVAHRRVRVVAQGQDDFGRTLARVELRGDDVGRWLVRSGHAWSYRFRRNAGPYAREEQLARQARRGLWDEARPLEPRAFRRWHGPCDAAGAMRQR